MNRFLLIFSLLSLLIFLQSCAVTTRPAPVRQDPLIGKIIDVKTAAPVSFETLIDTVSGSDVIYLSEKHDNADHHQFQHRVISSLVEKGIRPVIGFEFFSMEDTPDLLNFIDSAKVPHNKKAMAAIEKDLRKKLGWDTQSDESWAYYFDLLSLARDNGLDVAGIDLPATLKKRITRKGINGLNRLEKQQIFSTGLEDAPYRDYMFELFKAVHCGMGHPGMQETLYDTWVARNDKIAQSVTRLAGLDTGPAVIIIGGGHTEYGLGVMDRVEAINPLLTQVNVALKEIRIHPAPLSDYLAPITLKGHGTQPPADFIRLSQRQSYEDPCKAFEAHLKKMKARSKTDTP
jgi:uncharacterized iron-regulated protein